MSLPAPDRSPASWGILEGFHDNSGAWQTPPRETVESILDAMGASEERPHEGGTVRVLRAGQRHAVSGRGEVLTEEGTTIEVDGELPDSLPPGYHELHQAGRDNPITLIVAPPQCHLPGDLLWGVAVQLYALRSASSWGMGDLSDLRRFAQWSRSELGAGMILLNPLHAATPGLPQQSSPYFPSSREFRNPLYLRIEEVPGASRLGGQLDSLAAAGRSLNPHRRIDRDTVYGLKMAALEQLWPTGGKNPAFGRFCAAGGQGLEAFATFCALAEKHGGNWRCWPPDLRHPDSPAVAEARAAHHDRVRFHQWLQWLLDRQLRGAGARQSLIADLAIGVDPDGADAWIWQDVIAPNMRVGAPADAFAPSGQDWGLPPFDPWKLRAARYQPFIRTLRAAFQHAGGIRLDHVMGLFRLYWIPGGRPAQEGAYVRYPASELLDILALESRRAGAYVVGEDLGTVDPDVRRELAERKILSYRLFWFEGTSPEHYPARALAAVTTHDLPTLAGVWTGADGRLQEAAGLRPGDELVQLRARIQQATGAPDDLPVDDLVVATYAALGRAPCQMLAATLEDLLAVEERPNLPGTVDQWPNWSLALPRSLEEIQAAVLPRRVAAALRRDVSDPG